MHDHVAAPRFAKHGNHVADEELERVRLVGGVGQIREGERPPVVVGRDRHRLLLKSREQGRGRRPGSQFRRSGS